ncbi:DUF3147 family protein [Falsibacillus pallidus]|uniref:DUF3147 family protein n=1 Tax=Falsibacillus pallidus TaxID=493781 RepID=UPI003D969B2A
MYIFFKVMISAAVIGVVTEVARRFPAYGGIVAALPLVSLLSMIWLSVQGEKNAELSQFAFGVLIGFPATAALLFIVFICLKNSIPLVFSIILGVGGWGVFLFLQEFITKQIKAG